MGHVNLANLLLRRGQTEAAREHYETALLLDPNHPHAHQGLGAVLSETGEHRRAKLHFQKGFRGHSISSLPYRGAKPPVCLLQLVSSGGGNIPTASFLDDRIFQISVIIADFLDPTISLPPHHLVFNTIGDADLSGPPLEPPPSFIKRTRAPVINGPPAVRKTGRVTNAERLRALPGVVTPRTIAMPRAVLAGSDAGVAVAEKGFVFPLLLRSLGFHTGRNFVLVETAAELAAAAASLPGDDLLMIEYLDARGNDGSARKFRVMIVDGKIYPVHLAISRHWKVHSFTADMADAPDHPLEENAFLRDMPAVLGKKAGTPLC